MVANMMCWVVTRNRQFLVAVPEGLNRPRFSPYAYDAARIDNANDARAIAQIVGGGIHRFNPLTGELI